MRESGHNNAGESYGWLFPDGSFRESDWGTHGEEAEKIIIERGWSSEYYAGVSNARDFLCSRGFCLIHNPGRWDIRITHILPLTERQRDFLYAFFMDLGEKEKAEQYLREEF